ncbi:MAG: TIGR04283 family arsenosugar biosynthesis glycosyltransferase [Alphaproteobacteria bacterium]|nr:TIGR04283 family arsenosugar biosynthesis glycosyltransferase [Alphaproteobacteria bacterium]
MPDDAPETPFRRSGDPVTLAVVVPTLNAEAAIGRALQALAAPTPGIDLDVLVVDGGSTDATLDEAQRYGARILSAEGGRGPQLAAGAEAALGDWLLFLHADTTLPPNWPEIVRDFAARPDAARKAGYFRFVLDDPASPAARRLERAVAWRCRRLGLPYGDQGLLISRARYLEAGGFPAVPLMEDVALVRRIGRSDLVELPGAAITSAARYRRDGYLRRSLRNLCCLALYLLGVPPAAIVRLYG